MRYLREDGNPLVAISTESFVVPPDNRGFIYMVHDCTEPDYIKIGRTSNLHKRLLAYNSNRPRNSVQLVAVTEMFQDAVEVEARILTTINNFFEAVPSKGTTEWFSSEFKEHFLEAMKQAETFFPLAK